MLTPLHPEWPHLKCSCVAAFECSVRGRLHGLCLSLELPRAAVGLDELVRDSDSTGTQSRGHRLRPPLHGCYRSVHQILGTPECTTLIVLLVVFLGNGKGRRTEKTSIRRPSPRPQNPMTFTGVVLTKLVVLILPSCPDLLFPQHFTAPPGVAAQVMFLPVAISNADHSRKASPGTSMGVRRHWVVPSPSCPAELYPQHFTAPELTAQV